MQTSPPDRGDRLHPARTHPRYWTLRLLADAMRRIAASDALRPGRLMLDFGCGNKPYRPVFASKFTTYAGADLPGNPDADLTIGEDAALPLEDGTVDGVLSSQVLEHVTDPARYLREAFRVLRPGGSLILSTHGIWPYHPDPTDFWRWTADGLRKIVEEAGFGIVSVDSILTTPSVAVQLWQDATMNKLPKGLRRAYIRLLQAMIGGIERRNSGRFGSTAAIYVIHARKVA